MSYLDSMDADEQRRVSDMTGLPTESPAADPKPKPAAPVDTVALKQRMARSLALLKALSYGRADATVHGGDPQQRGQLNDAHRDALQNVIAQSDTLDATRQKKLPALPPRGPR